MLYDFIVFFAFYYYISIYWIIFQVYIILYHVNMYVYIYIHIYTHTCTYTCNIDMYIVTCDVLSDTFHDGATPLKKALGTSSEFFDGQEAGLRTRMQHWALHEFHRRAPGTFHNHWAKQWELRLKNILHVLGIFTCLNEVSNSAPLR